MALSQTRFCCNLALVMLPRSSLVYNFHRRLWLPSPLHLLIGDIKKHQMIFLDEVVSRLHTFIAGKYIYKDFHSE